MGGIGNIQDDQLYCISKGDVDECTHSVTQSTSDTLGGMAEQTGQGDDSYRIHGKDQAWIESSGLDRNTDRDEDEQHIDPAVAQGAFGVSGEANNSILHPDEQWALSGLIGIFFRLRAGRVTYTFFHLSILSRSVLRGLGVGLVLTLGIIRGRRVSFRPRVNPVCIAKR